MYVHNDDNSGWGGPSEKCNDYRDYGLADYGLYTMVGLFAKALARGAFLPGVWLDGVTFGRHHGWRDHDQCRDARRPVLGQADDADLLRQRPALGEAGRRYADLSENARVIAAQITLLSRKAWISAAL